MVVGRGDGTCLGAPPARSSGTTVACVVTRGGQHEIGRGALVAPDPPLADELIRLRPPVPADVDPITRACQDPEIARFIPIPSPYHRHHAVDYVERTRREWAAGTRAAFAAVATDDDEPGVPLGVINLAVSGSTGNSAYWVAPGCRGLGLAGRALRLVTRWGFDELGLAVVLLEIREENTASIAVAASAGFHRAGRLDVNTTTGKTGGLIYSRLAAYPWIDP